MMIVSVSFSVVSSFIRVHISPHSFLCPICLVHITRHPSAYDSNARHDPQGAERPTDQEQERDLSS